MLYLLRIDIVAIGWIIFAAIFLLRGRKRQTSAARKRDRDSIIGVVLQAIALGLVWIRRPRGISILAGNVSVQILLLGLVLVIVLASLLLMWGAVRTLGKQWSITARVLEEHALITAGPYRFVRHPIYTGMLGMLLAAGLAFSYWLAFIAALIFFALGTRIRIRSEEKLLREQFGASYDDYARDVPALLPRLRSR